jgi:Zn-dependent protease with chaperone function
MPYDYSSFYSGMRERFGNLLLLGILSTYVLYTNDASVFLGGPSTKSKVFQVGLLGLLLFMNMVFAFYLLHPIQVRRSFARSGLSHRYENFIQRCATQMRRFGNPSAAISLTNDIEQQNALAYGLPGWRCLLVGGGLRPVAAKRPDRFESVIAHEASHFRHGDVDFGYLSRATLYALSCVCIIIVSAHIYRIYELRIGSEYLLLRKGPLLFQAGTIAAVMFLANIEYRALLRSREHYADVEAARYVGAAFLLDTIRAAHPTTGRRTLSSLEILRTHPTESRRSRVIAEPSILLRRDQLQALLTGIVTSQLILLTNVIPPQPFLKYSGTPLEIGFQDLPLLAFSAGLVSIFLSVMASQNLRIVTLYALRLSSFYSLICSSIMMNAFVFIGISLGFCWWIMLGILSGVLVLQLTSISTLCDIFLTCLSLFPGMFFYNLVLSVLILSFVRYRGLREFSMKFRVFLSVIWMFGTFQVAQVIVAISSNIAYVGGPVLFRILVVGVGVSMSPALLCLLMWLFIRGRKHLPQEENDRNVNGVVVERNAPDREKFLFGIRPSGAALIVVCIGMLFIDGVILHYSRVW